MSLRAFFEARSVAVIGASRKAGKVGREILTGLVDGGFDGAVYPVNPNIDRIDGLPCFHDVGSIGQPVDLAVVVVPAGAVPRVVRDCGRAGVRNVIVITSGFGESGPDGQALEKTLKQTAKESGVRFLGPNCLGLMVPAAKLNASFGGPMPEPGSIGYLSQSGSLLAAIVDMARSMGVGFSKLISIGNKTNIDELEVLKALGGDDETRVIAGYLETIADGDAYIREAERISHDKPILLMKAGETGAGAAAARSHTGRLAGSRRAYECVFERAGVIRCPSISAQFDYARALASQPLPAGPGVAVIANTGGLGIMATDAAERLGLQLAELSDATIDELRRRLPTAANVNNPVDVLGDALADRFEAALELVLADANVHSAIVLLTPHAMTQCDETAGAVVRAAAAGGGKPVLTCFLGASRMESAAAVLRAAGVPNYRSPEFAVSSLKAMCDYARWRRRPKRVVKLFAVNRRKVEKAIDRHVRLGQPEIGEMEAKDILDAYGFVTPRGLLATSGEQAAGFADQLGYPVVLKIWSPDIVHKTEVGGVRTALTNAQEVADAFDLMMYRIPRRAPEAHILGVLVQETCTAGREVILGMNRDPHYGPLMMFGTGGVMVEVLRDVAFYLAPLTADEAREMLRSTRTYQLLAAGDEQDAIDIDAVAEGLQRLSQLVTEFPQIQEVDINPYVVGPAGVTPVAVDARITVGARGC
jgi:acetyl coenzyme A synthetase (ADP forming)-like protein